MGVHVTGRVLAGHHDGLTRVEGIGPMLLEQVADLVQHRDLTVLPVIDLNHARSVNGYERPTAVKVRTRLRTVYDVFPHSTSRATSRLDHDHPTPYVPVEATRPDRRPQRRTPDPAPPPRQDPRRLPGPKARPRRLPVGHPPRPGPHRHRPRHPQESDSSEPATAPSPARSTPAPASTTGHSTDQVQPRQGRPAFARPVKPVREASRRIGGWAVGQLRRCRRLAQGLEPIVVRVAHGER